jgi:hypothetical protein
MTRAGFRPPAHPSRAVSPIGRAVSYSPRSNWRAKLRRQDRQDGNFGADPLGQGDAVLDSFPGEFRPVCGYQDMGIHRLSLITTFLAGHRSPPQLNLPALANRGMRLCGSFNAQTNNDYICR